MPNGGRTGRGALVWALALVFLLVAPVGAAGEHGAEPLRPGSVWPVPGVIIRDFDPPAQPYGPGHRGVDIGALPGTTVRAALPGTIRFVGQVAGRGWVTVDHGGGLQTTYGDLGTFAVTSGQRVAAGDGLGTLSGAAAHLDWGAKLDGEYIDPLSLLVRWPLALVPLESARG